MSTENLAIPLEQQIALLRAALIKFDWPHGDLRRGYFCNGCDTDGEDRETSEYHDPACLAARKALEATK